MWFQWRALRHARRSEELFSFLSATRPPDLKLLLELADGCHRVVELGTGTGWTAISLVLADPARRVVTYDAVDRDAASYLQLVAPDVRQRVQIVLAPGVSGPVDDEPIDLLYIDSSHERQPTLDEWRVWAPHLRPGAPVLFDDYNHPDFPGVREAVEELGLEGESRGKVFLHRRAAGRSRP